MTDNKFELEKKAKLKFYMYVARPLGVNLIIPGEKTFYTLAYSENEAQDKAERFVYNMARNTQKDYRPVFYGDIDVENILDKLKIKAPEKERVQFIKPAPPSKEEYFSHLKLFKDKFIKDEKDKKVLDELIIKYAK